MGEQQASTSTEGEVKEHPSENQELKAGNLKAEGKLSHPNARKNIPIEPKYTDVYSHRKNLGEHRHRKQIYNLYIKKKSIDEAK